MPSDDVPSNNRPTGSSDHHARERSRNDAGAVDLTAPQNVDQADELAAGAIADCTGRMGDLHGQPAAELKGTAISVLREQVSHEVGRQWVQAGKREIDGATPQDGPARKRRKGSTSDGPQLRSGSARTNTSEGRQDHPRPGSPSAERSPAELQPSTPSAPTNDISFHASLGAEGPDRSPGSHVALLEEGMHGTVARAVARAVATEINARLQPRLSQLEAEIAHMLRHPPEFRQMNIELQYDDGRQAETVWLGVLRREPSAGPISSQDIRFDMLQAWIANQRDESEFTGSLQYIDPVDGRCVSIEDDKGLGVAVCTFRQTSKDMVVKVSEGKKVRDS